MIKINKEKNMGKLCWPNTGRGEAHIPGALHCRSSTCLSNKKLAPKMKMLLMLLILRQMLKIMKHIHLVLYSLWCEFFTLLVHMDTASVFLMGDCIKYVNDLYEGMV